MATVATIRPYSVRALQRYRPRRKKSQGRTMKVRRMSWGALRMRVTRSGDRRGAIVLEVVLAGKRRLRMRWYRKLSIGKVVK